VRDADGRASRLAGSQTDITDRRSGRGASCATTRSHDTLTGLANRALFIDRLHQCVQRARRQSDHKFAVLFLGSRSLQLITDPSATPSATSCSSASQAAGGSVARVDSVAPIGRTASPVSAATSFVLLLDGLRADADALRVAERLKNALAEPFVIDGKELFASMASASRSVAPTATSPTTSCATPTSRSTRPGPGAQLLPGVRLDHAASAMSRWWLENELRRAIERNELKVETAYLLGDHGELREFEALPALAPSQARHDLARRVHSHRRGHRPHHVAGHWVPSRRRCSCERDEQGIARRTCRSRSTSRASSFANPTSSTTWWRCCTGRHQPHRIKLEVTESALMRRG